MAAFSIEESALSIDTIISHILLFVNYDTVITYSSTSKTARRKIYKNITFWKLRAELLLKIPEHIFKQTILSPARRYHELTTKAGEVSFKSEIYMDLDDFVIWAIQQDRDDLVEYAEKKLNFDQWETTLIEYAAQGNKKRVEYYLNIVNWYDSAAEGAVRGGYRRLFDHIRKIAPENHKWRLHTLVSNAAQSGNIELFEYIRSFDDNWEWFIILNSAVISGDQTMFDHVLNLIPADYGLMWDHLVIDSISSNNIQLFDHILKLAPKDYNWKWDCIIEKAVASHNRKIFKHIQSIIPIIHEQG